MNSDAITMPTRDAAANAQECTHCGAPFRSRNQLFRHLSTLCDPSAAAKGADGVTHRLALCVGYLGPAFHGSFGVNPTPGACNEVSLRPDRLTVEGAVVGAARRAFGEGCVKSITQAVRSLLHSFTPSLLHSLTPSLTPSLRHYFTHSLTHFTPLLAPSLLPRVNPNP